jgi:hypothetical protein
MDTGGSATTSTKGTATKSCWSSKSHGLLNMSVAKSPDVESAGGGE